MIANNPKSCVLSGSSKHTIDGKSRVAVPSSFRTHLPADSQTRFVLNLGKERCIEIHPADEWKLVHLPKILMLNNDIKRERLKRRAKLAFCYEVEADSASRVLVPKALMDYAGLVPGQECVITTAGDYLELMSTKVFGEQTDPILADYSAITDEDPEAAKPAAAVTPEPEIE